MQVSLNNCIVCGSSDDLKTELTITVDEQRIVVLLCDTHAEDTTPRVAKEAYIKRQEQITKFLAEAKALGLSFDNSKSITTASAPRQQPIRERQVIQEADVGALPDDFIDTQIVDSQKQRVISVAGAVGGATAEAHQQYAPQSIDGITPEVLVGKVRESVVLNRAGQPIKIPATRLDGLGTTNIVVVDSGGDIALQKRFKQIGQASVADAHAGYGGGYEAGRPGDTIRACPLCNGIATVKQRGLDVMCPKCKGAGVITL